MGIAAAFTAPTLPFNQSSSTMTDMNQTAESRRLAAANAHTEPWRLFGPYLSERQWGTVREDYSPGGMAWEYFPHDHARSRAYRWGEDGIAGFSDQQSRLCLSLALWNGKGERRLLSLLRGHRMKCLLRRMLDETEFLSDYGVRALSKVHEREPYRLNCGGRCMKLLIGRLNRKAVCSPAIPIGAAPFGCR